MPRIPLLPYLTITNPYALRTWTLGNPYSQRSSKGLQICLTRAHSPYPEVAGRFSPGGPGLSAQTHAVVLLAPLAYGALGKLYNTVMAAHGGEPPEEVAQALSEAAQVILALNDAHATGAHVPSSPIPAAPPAPPAPPIPAAPAWGQPAPAPPQPPGPQAPAWGRPETPPRAPSTVEDPFGFGPLFPPSPPTPPTPPPPNLTGPSSSAFGLPAELAPPPPRTDPPPPCRWPKPPNAPRLFPAGWDVATMGPPPGWSPPTTLPRIRRTLPELEAFIYAGVDADLAQAYEGTVEEVIAKLSAGAPPDDPTAPMWINC